MIDALTDPFTIGVIFGTAVGTMLGLGVGLAWAQGRR
jgi:hypothetical protein